MRPLVVSTKTKLPVALATVVALLLVSFAAVRLSGALGDHGKGPVLNPDAGLTDEQRDVRYQASRADFDAKFAAWQQAIDFDRVNWTQLPRLNLQGQYDPPLPTFAASIRAANVVIEGTVARVRPDGFGSVITLTVEHAMKGSTAPTIEISLPGGLRPGPDWSSIFLAEAEPMPFLLPGERAVLLLRPVAGNGERYEVQSGSGTYRVADGRVTALAVNPFGRDIADSEAAFLEAVRQEAAKGP